jgi:hypothetical protein
MRTLHCRHLRAAVCLALVQALTLLPPVSHAGQHPQSYEAQADPSDPFRPSITGNARPVLSRKRFFLMDGFYFWLDPDHLLIAESTAPDSRYRALWYEYSLSKGTAKPLDGLNDVFYRLDLDPCVQGGSDNGALTASALVTKVPGLPCILYRDLKQDRWVLIGLSGRIRQSWPNCKSEGEVFWSSSGRSAVLGVRTAGLLANSFLMENARHATILTPALTDSSWAMELNLNRSRVQYTAIDSAGVLTTFLRSGLNGAALLENQQLIVPGVAAGGDKDGSPAPTGEFYRCRPDGHWTVIGKWRFPLPETSGMQVMLADVSNADERVVVGTREPGKSGTVQKLWVSRYGASHAELVATIAPSAYGEDFFTDIHFLQWIPGASAVSFIVDQTLYVASIPHR